MKHLVIFLVLFATGFRQELLAFDPAGGPPPSSSLSRTIQFVANVKRPLHDIRDEAVDSALDFIRILEIPKNLGVRIDASRMKLPEDTRVSVVGENLTILAAAGIVAEQINADILIQPGVIYLVPKEQKPEDAPAAKDGPAKD